jgi:hypothetical protein
MHVLSGGDHGGVGKRSRRNRIGQRAEQIIPKLISLRSVITMSRRAAIVEEFDDDTDLSLPSRSLPGTGSRGAILEEIVDSNDDDGDSDEAPDLLHHSAMGGPALQPSARDTRVTDITPYKKYAQTTQSRT